MTHVYVFLKKIFSVVLKHLGNIDLDKNPLGNFPKILSMNKGGWEEP
jgi:hypothetical protein